MRMLCIILGNSKKINLIGLNIIQLTIKSFTFTLLASNHLFCLEEMSKHMRDKLGQIISDRFKYV